MKKNVFCFVTAFIAMTSVNAQVDTRLFNHLAVGLNVGTPGIGADVAMPVTKWFDVEAGFSIMPKITYNTSVHPNLTQYNVSTTSVQTLGLDNIPIQGKLNMVNGKFLVNFYPFSITSFHLTVGAYFGKGEIVEVYNTVDGQLSVVNDANAAIRQANQDYPDLNQQEIGLALGDYLLQPDANGNARATLNTNGFKPYVGIGIGRAVPKKRVNFKFDMGVMFWGTPDVVDHNGVSLSKQNWDGKDGGAFRVISKFKVYPVLNFRVSGRIF